MNGLSPQVNALSFPQCIGLLIEGNQRLSALAYCDLVIKMPVRYILQVSIFSHPDERVVRIDPVLMIC